MEEQMQEQVTKPMTYYKDKSTGQYYYKLYCVTNVIMTSMGHLTQHQEFFSDIETAKKYAEHYKIMSPYDEEQLGQALTEVKIWEHMNI